MKHDPSLRFCVCDACAMRTAASHVDADEACGRDWTCSCGTCRIAREVTACKTAKDFRWRLRVDVAFAKVEATKSRLAAVRRIKREL
jgi:hypothetical protein